MFARDTGRRCDPATLVAESPRWLLARTQVAQGAIHYQTSVVSVTITK
jgi:hypothetical protein